MTLEKFLIHGGKPLEGTIKVNGAKNAALPILAASLLTTGRSVLHNVPDLEDINSALALLDTLGVRSSWRKDGALELYVEDDKPHIAPYKLVRKMRASICVLGPLLTRRGKAKVSQPGGCNIGVRPVDLHVKGLRALGADIESEHGYLIAKARALKGCRIYLGGPHGSTVSGTANVMMAATLADGVTIIDHAACEPEIEDLAGYLNACGADIRGAGTPTMTIVGVTELTGAEYTIIPDRIEAGTFMMAAAMTGGDVTIRNTRPEHLSAVIDALSMAGVAMDFQGQDIRITGNGEFQPVDVTALPYPGFPTDLQSQMTVLLSLANGLSVVTDKIYPDRFIHVAELNRMRANIRKEGNLVVIKGLDSLSGASVMASDLRASACLVLAGLVAEDVTEINRIYHIDRGYERIEERLNALGADIARVDADTDPIFVELFPDASPELKRMLFQRMTQLPKPEPKESSEPKPKPKVKVKAKAKAKSKPQPEHQE